MQVSERKKTRTRTQTFCTCLSVSATEFHIRKYLIFQDCISLRTSEEMFFLLAPHDFRQSGNCLHTRKSWSLPSAMRIERWWEFFEVFSMKWKILFAYLTRGSFRLNESFIKSLKHINFLICVCDCRTVEISFDYYWSTSTTEQLAE